MIGKILASHDLIVPKLLHKVLTYCVLKRIEIWISLTGYFELSTETEIFFTIPTPSIHINCLQALVNVE